MKLEYVVPDSVASEVLLHQLYLLGALRSIARTVAFRSWSNSCTLYILHSSVFALSGGCCFTLVVYIHDLNRLLWLKNKTGVPLRYM